MMFDEIKKHREQVVTRILKSMGYDSHNDNIDDIEKARNGYYKDNAENRRMGRVGLQYSKSGLRRGNMVTATLPTGHKVQGKFQEYYGDGGKQATIKDENGKLYGVRIDKIEKVTSDRKQQRKDIAQRRIQFKIKQLENEREAISLDMEDEIAYAAEVQARKNNTSFEEEMDKISCDGNHPIVVKYAKELSKIDKKLEKLQSRE